MGSRFPFSPFPDGWFLACFSDQLKRGALITKTFMGQEVIIYRGRKGEACVADAFCPHLGAHIGKGGCVKDGAVVCPFHGFRFDTKGDCVETPYGDSPAKAKLKTWPVREFDGLVMAYYDAEGRPPSWQIEDKDPAGWSELTHHTLRLKGHPQETTENSVDRAHLIHIHKYEDLKDTSPLKIEGPHLSGAYSIERSAGILNNLTGTLDVQFHVDVWGLGYSMVETHTPRYGMWGRMYILATPSDGEYIDLHLALRVKDLDDPAKVVPGLQHVPPPLLTKLLQKYYMRGFIHDVNQDFEVWENKGYVEKPVLCRGDGPLYAFRRYARQFYPELREDSAQPQERATPGNSEPPGKTQAVS